MFFKVLVLPLQGSLKFRRPYLRVVVVVVAVVVVVVVVVAAVVVVVVVVFVVVYLVRTGDIGFLQISIIIVGVNMCLLWIKHV